eukprot:1158955-Pelagomonas_calceolata.AAC.18
MALKRLMLIAYAYHDNKALDNEAHETVEYIDNEAHDAEENLPASIQHDKKASTAYSGWLSHACAVEVQRTALPDICIGWLSHALAVEVQITALSDICIGWPSHARAKGVQRTALSDICFGWLSHASAVENQKLQHLPTSLAVREVSLHYAVLLKMKAESRDKCLQALDNSLGVMTVQSMKF